MQTNKQTLDVTKGLAFSTILEYKEDGKRVFTDYTGAEFKAQFRAAKSDTATLFATAVPVAVGLGQLRVTLTDVQTALFSGTTIYYDILYKPQGGLVEKLYEGTVTLTVPVSVTQWENTPPITTPSVLAGLFKTNQTITLSCNEVGAKTYYSVDGSAPTTLYSTPIVISSTTTLKFYSIDTAGNSEAVQSVTYTIDKVAPVTAYNLVGDTVTLTADEPATIYYSTNGAAPTTEYTAPFVLASGTYTIKFYAVDTATNAEVVQTVSDVTIA